MLRGISPRLPATARALHAIYHYFLQGLNAGALSCARRRFTPGADAPAHIAIDGKTLRGSRRLDDRPLHVLSAFAARLSAVTGGLPPCDGAPPRSRP